MKVLLVGALTAIMSSATTRNGGGGGSSKLLLFLLLLLPPAAEAACGGGCGAGGGGLQSFDECVPVVNVAAAAALSDAAAAAASPSSALSSTCGGASRASCGSTCGLTCGSTCGAEQKQQGRANATTASTSRAIISGYGGTTSILGDYAGVDEDEEDDDNHLAVKNYFMLDTVRTRRTPTAAGRGGVSVVDMVAGGCPDHPYFVDVRRVDAAPPSTGTGGGGCSSHGDCSGGCGGCCGCGGGRRKMRRRAADARRVEGAGEGEGDNSRHNDNQDIFDKMTAFRNEMLPPQDDEPAYDPAYDAAAVKDAADEDAADSGPAGCGGCGGCGSCGGCGGYGAKKEGGETAETATTTKTASCSATPTCSACGGCGGCGGCDTGGGCGCGGTADGTTTNPKTASSLAPTDYDWPTCPDSTNGIVDFQGGGGGRCGAPASCGAVQVGACSTAPSCGLSSYSSTPSSNCGGCGSGCGGCGSCGCGGGGCSACGSKCGGKCGGRCNSCSSGSKAKCASGNDDQFNLYTPTYHHSILSIPEPTAVADADLLPVSLAFYREGDYPVGLAVNGVPIYNHSITKIFDSCMGHVDGNGCHRYHYHLIPTCLLDNLGQDMTSVNRTFWMAEDPLESARGWPDRSTPSPVIGWALDGVPIMGPYDDSGRLQLGRSAGVHSTLDECNGKYSEVTGIYAYYMTPNAPYAVGCFRGGLGVGTYEDRSIFGNAICPAAGLPSEYCDEDEGSGGGDEECVNAVFTTMQTTEEQCALACPGPYFLFQTCPELSGQRWQTYSLTFGVLFLIICFLPPFGLLVWFECRPACTNGKRLKILNPRILILIFSAIAGFATMFGLLVDPHYTRKVLPPVLVGILYGLRYPCINSCLVLLILWLHDLVDSAKRIRRMKEFLPKTKWIFFGVTVGEFVTQLLADTLRALGYAYNWLIFCQVFYVGWGILLTSGLATFSTLLWRQLPPSKRKFVRRLLSCSLAGSIFGLSLTAGSIYDLAFRTVDPGDGSSGYFSFMTTMRCLEVLTIFFLWFGAVTADTARAAAGRVNRSLRHLTKTSSQNLKSSLKKSSSLLGKKHSGSNSGSLHQSMEGKQHSSSNIAHNVSFRDELSPNSLGSSNSIGASPPPETAQSPAAPGSV